jgi:FAD/FMN-containing dehydrogenase
LYNESVTEESKERGPSLLTRIGKSVSQLRSQFDGPVISPEDAEYDAARKVFYGGIDRRPGLIVRADGDDDVARVVSLAGESGLELAVRSGGHSLVGHGVSDGGIVLDLSRMKGVDIDVEGRTAWAQTGLTARDYTDAAGAHGLATGFGDTGSVGIGGLTLGGGVGFLLRKHGLTIDDLLAADVVTADGRLLRADADAHPDLYWAIRGGGGNFGVATRFRFRMHELERVVGGILILPATADVVHSFVQAAEAAPDELSTIANVFAAPPMPFLPPEAHGKLVVMAMVCYAGEMGAADRILAPFRGLAEPIADMVRPMPYPEIYLPDEEGFPLVESIRTLFVDAIDRPAAETIVERIRASNAPMTAAQIRVLGGAMARVPVEATAFAHRKSRIMMNVAALYERVEDSAVYEPWVQEFADALRGADAGAYVNFLTNEGEERIRAAYPAGTWDRLHQVKARYDPTNLFRLNQNIRP